MRTTPDERESALRWVGPNITPRYEKATIFDAFNDLAEAERALAEAQNDRHVVVEGLREATNEKAEWKARAERAERALAEARAALCAEVEMVNALHEALAESRAEVEALREALRSIQLLARSEHQSGRNDIWLTVYDRAAAALATSTAPEPEEQP